jgi:4-diphosphocytidyl-2-C-methyl-D-erythritol kinase
VSPSSTLTVAAPAKVNLFLRVVGRRDDGYHDLESLIVPISLADRLEIHAHADPASFRTLSFSLAVLGHPDLVRRVPADESNLVLRAALAMAERAEVRGFAEFRLEKRIPAAAGLGGGSSDAAAALSGLNALWGEPLDPEQLGSVAAEVGSDVPALLLRAPALIEGRGERVRPGPDLELSLAVVTFGFGVATTDAYRWWDQDEGATGPGPGPGPGPGRALEAMASGSLDASLVFNDLEEPVTRRHPEIERAKEALVEAGAIAAVMCGSGPSVAGFLPDGMERLPSDAEAGLEAISGRPVTYAGSWRE